MIHSHSLKTSSIPEDSTVDAVSLHSLQKQLGNFTREKFSKS